jgi:hypothetical protein
VHRRRVTGPVIVRGRAKLSRRSAIIVPGWYQSQTLQPPQELRSWHDALMATSGFQPSRSATVGNDRRKRTDPQSRELLRGFLGGQLGEFNGSVAPQLCQSEITAQTPDIARRSRCFERCHDYDRGSARGLCSRDRFEPGWSVL